jgi:hypothetical protein
VFHKLAVTGAFALTVFNSIMPAYSQDRTGDLTRDQAIKILGGLNFQLRTAITLANVSLSVREDEVDKYRELFDAYLRGGNDIPVPAVRIGPVGYDTKIDNLTILKVALNKGLITSVDWRYENNYLVGRAVIAEAISDTCVVSKVIFAYPTDDELKFKCNPQTATGRVSAVTGIINNGNYATVDFTVTMEPNDIGKQLGQNAFNESWRGQFAHYDDGWRGQSYSQVN